MSNIKQENKYTLFPIQYESLWKFYKLHESTFWTVEEVRLTDDLVDWNEKLSDNERHFIKHVLAFFAASDGIVNENLVVNFYNKVEIAEARSFYTVQMMMESIHCVVGQTKILTDQGYKKISELEDKYVNVWNGYVFSNVLVVYTGRKPITRVTLSNGLSLSCSSEHKWYVNENKEPVITNDLKIGDKISSGWTYPVVKAKQYSNILVLLGSIFTIGKIEYDPVLESSYMYFKSDESTLNNLQLVLSELSVASTVKLSMSKYTLLVSCREMAKLAQFEELSMYVDFKVNKQLIEKSETRGHGCACVTNIEYTGKYENTYCFNEPLNHTGIFNGIYTGQSEQYSVLIDTYVSDSTEKNNLFNAIETIPSVKKKAEWAIKWIDDGMSRTSDFMVEYKQIEKLLKDKGASKDLVDAMSHLTKEPSSTFEQQLLAFICVEGIFFSGSFCAIYWLKNRGLMPGLATANQFISRDENLHAEFAIELYKINGKRLPTDIVHSIFDEAVEIEKEFITESLPVSLIGMNCELMKEYIKYVADRWLVLLDYPKLYNVKNPFGFMELISLGTKENFFEINVTEYSRANINVDSGASNRNLMFEEDF